jgi:hypothetical protein
MPRLLGSLSAYGRNDEYIAMAGAASAYRFAATGTFLSNGDPVPCPGAPAQEVFKPTHKVRNL